MFFLSDAVRLSKSPYDRTIPRKTAVVTRNTVVGEAPEWLRRQTIGVPGPRSSGCTAGEAADARERRPDRNGVAEVTESGHVQWPNGSGLAVDGASAGDDQHHGGIADLAAGW
jgi:hypothetical protein